MVDLVICPACGVQLAVPTELRSTKAARCPQCAADFLVGDARTRRLLSIVPLSDATANGVAGSQPAAETTEQASRFDDSARHEALREFSLGKDEESREDSDAAGRNGTRSVPLTAQLIMPQRQYLTPSLLGIGGRNGGVAQQYRSAIALANRSAQRQPKMSLLRRVTGIAVLLGALLAGLWLLYWNEGSRQTVLRLAGSLSTSMLPNSFHSSAHSTWGAPPVVSTASSLASRQVPFDTDERFSTISVRETDVAFPGVSPVLDSPYFSLADVSQFLREAIAARPAIWAGSLDRQADRRQKGQAYLKLCALAHVATFLDAPSHLLAVDVQRYEISQFFRETLRDTRAMAELDFIGSKWLNTPRSGNRGAVVVGRVKRIDAVGKYMEAWLMTRGGGEFPVLIGSSGVRAGDTVLVAGSVVSDARERILGYSGDSKRVLWPTMVGTVLTSSPVYGHLP